MEPGSLPVRWEELLHLASTLEPGAEGPGLAEEVVTDENLRRTVHPWRKPNPHWPSVSRSWRRQQLKMLSSITKIGRVLATEPVLVMFSGGKDSIVTLDLAMRFLPKENLTVIHYYFVPGLSIKERVLTWYERKYGITIHRVPDAEVIAMQTGKKSYGQGQQEAVLRQQFNSKWIMTGVRKQDSLARRGMLAGAVDGIDERNGKLYPVGEWSTKQVLSYVKLNRLILPVEYNMGWSRDFYIPNAQGLLFLKNNFPDDYKKVIQTFPNLEAMAKKAEFYGCK